MSALPAEASHDDPCDPLRILGELPESERGPFLATYQQYAAAAQDPAGWSELQRWLKLSSMRAIAANRPGYADDVRNALGGTGRGMPLEDAIRMLRDRQ